MMKQSEAIEREAWRDMFAAAASADRMKLGLAAETCSDVLALRSARLDHLLFNRVIGLAGANASGDRLDRILDSYEEERVERFFVHLRPQDEEGELGRQLRQRGLNRYRRAWDKMVRTRGAGAPRAQPCALAVRPGSRENAVDFATIIAQGFDMPDAARALLVPLVGRDRWHALLAFDGERPVAAGALFIDGGVGYLPFAATLPSHRGRGAQGTLMAERLRIAWQLGCALTVTETGVAVAGEPNHSHNNMRRLGFRSAGLRYNYTPEGTTWLRKVG